MPGVYSNVGEEVGDGVGEGEEVGEWEVEPVSAVAEALTDGEESKNTGEL